MRTQKFIPTDVLNQNRKFNKFKARANKGRGYGIVMGSETATPGELFGSIVWAIGCATRIYNRSIKHVKNNSFVSGGYDQKKLIAYVKSLKKPYIVASPADFYYLGLYHSSPAAKQFANQFTKMIWAVDCDSRGLTLMPIR
jgi:hypothetical protein